MGKRDDMGWHQALVTSNSVEWYTPTRLVESVVAFFGEIDLDPCADPEKRIPAKRHYCERGLELPWKGRMYCNLPMGAISCYG